MLSRLIIQHYAIISSLDLSFPEGLSVITGETGAGKSILLGALGLALGRRADGKILPDDRSKCVVEAHFQLKNNHLAERFAQEGLDYDSQLICRREITPGGKSRSFINDTPVSLKLLQEITDQLIELHHQHDNLALQHKSYQRDVLDSLSGALPHFEEYSSLYRTIENQQHTLRQLKEKEAASARQKDFLQFQIEELHGAQLQEGETEKLESSQNLLQSAEQIEVAIRQMQSVLSDHPQSVVSQLAQLNRQLVAIRHVNPSLNSMAERIEALRLEAQDLSMEAARLDGMAQHNPKELDRIQSRLNQIFTLVKKYQCKDESGLLALRDNLSAELSSLNSVADEISSLEALLEVSQKDLLSAATQLTKKRKSGITSILPKMNTLLKELGMPNARFDIELVPSNPGPDGADEIRFLFSANRGSQLQPIQAVASGGELSRLSLAIKSLYATKAALPTIIFDEIDTGISGEVAWRMGQLIRELSKGHQVLMITHSPQIAVHAGVQFHVSKVHANGRDESAVTQLTASMREQEIAKMLSGDPPSKEAIANAKSLLKSAAN